MIGLEPEFYPYEEAFFRNDGINRILRSIRAVDRIDVNKPIHIGALRFLLEDGINDVRIDVPFAIGNSHVYQVCCFFRYTGVCLQVFDQGDVVFEIDKLRMTVAKIPGLQQNKHQTEEHHCNRECKPAPMIKLAEVRYEEHSFEREEH